MITEDYVSFEIAKLLKEKGFDTAVRHYYQKINDITYHIGDFRNWNAFDMWYSMPTLQMVMKWLREEKGVYIEIPIVGMEWEAPTKWYFGWRCQTKDVIDRLRSQDANYTSYEEAAEEAIKHCLNNLI